MAIYPESVVDIAEMSWDKRVAKIVRKLENKIDSNLKSRDFVRMDKYDDDKWDWPELKRQLKRSKKNKGVAYIIKFGHFGIDLGEYEINEIQAAYKRIRRIYQTHDWFNVIFSSEGSVIYSVAIIKEGMWR